MNVGTVAAVRKFSRREYDSLVEMGWFRDEHVELIDGILVAMSPQGSRHAEAVSRLTTLLVSRLATRATVRIQLPLGVGDDAEPEPDVAVVPRGDYSRGHPETAHLVIEVSDSSASTDRTVKAELYARGGIAEYWLVDLAARAVDVFRRPEDGRYLTVTRFDADARLASLAFPDAVVAVADILPTG